MKFATHAALVSDQPMATLAPLLDPALGCQRAILIHGAFRSDNARWLSRVLERHGVETRLEGLTDAFDLESLRTELALALPSDEPILVNISGGSKPMSIAAFEVAGRLGHQPCYVRGQDDHLVWMPATPDTPPTDLPAPHPVADRLTIRDYLAALGLTMEPAGLTTAGDPEKVAALASGIASGKYGDQPAILSRALQNRLIHEGLKPLPNDVRSGCRGFLEACERAGLLRRAPAPRGAYELAQGARLFIGGGWLESHAEATLKTLAYDLPRLQDIATGFLIRRQDDHDPETAVRNEIDVACLYDNRLHIIECKTGRMQGTTASSHGESVVQKLDMLRDLVGGIHGRAILLSRQPPSPAARRRAHRLGLTTWYGNDPIRHLRTRLADWLSQG